MTNFAVKPMIESLSTVDKNIGKPMGDFEYWNIRSGELENLNQHEDKMVLLNFWGTYCPPCIEELPDLKKLELEYSSELVVIAISDEHPEKIETFIEKIETPSIIGSKQKEA